MMGTRTGDLDVGAFIYILQKEKLTPQVGNVLVNKHSGLLGISGISPDMREVESAAAAGNYRAKLALEMYAYRVKKYIGAYTAAMNGLDILVFTGGIGENSDLMRKMILEDLSYLGIKFDAQKNEGLRGKEALISKPDSKVKVVVIPTNEELMIALDTERIVGEK
jgi:acetate kinase